MDTDDQFAERLLNEAESAVIELDWSTVQARCQAVLALDPGNKRAERLNEAAQRAHSTSALADPALTPSASPDPSDVQQVPPSLAPVELATSSESEHGQVVSASAPTHTDMRNATVFTVVALVLFFPLGLFLMWLIMPWSIRTKRLITGLLVWPAGAWWVWSNPGTSRLLRGASASAAVIYLLLVLGLVLNDRPNAGQPSQLSRTAATSTSVAVPSPTAPAALEWADACKVAISLALKELKSPSTAKVPGGSGFDACSRTRSSTSKDADGHVVWNFTGTVDPNDGSSVMQYVVEVVDVGDGTANTSKLVSFSVAPPPPPPTPTPTATPIPLTAPLLIEPGRGWSHSSSYATYQGQVTNNTGSPMRNVQAVVIYKTSDGTFITSDSALIDFNPLLPGQTSPFSVITRYNPLMATASIQFKMLLGGTIEVQERVPR